MDALQIGTTPAEIIYGAMWIFLIYGFLGWCAEVVFAAVCLGKFVNRGFLCGPICPIYGFGVLIVGTLLTPVADNALLLFVCSVLLTSALEFITGWVLERMFNEKWWDYSDDKFNLKGYICLKFSLMWGVACVIVMKTIYPMTLTLIHHFPLALGITLMCICLVLLVSDLTITLVASIGFAGRMKRLAEVEAALKKISGEIGEELFGGVKAVKAVSEKHGTQLDELSENRRKLLLKYKSLLTKYKLVDYRLSRAFPKLGDKVYGEWLEKLKKFKDMVNR